MTTLPALSLLEEKMAICRLEAGAAIPEWAWQGEIVSITRTGDELSIVCREHGVPAGVSCERGWRCLKVAGPLDFSLVGILASLATPLAEAGISIFALSTYDTDYLLLREEQVARAVEVLRGAGFGFDP